MMENNCFEDILQCTQEVMMLELIKTRHICLQSIQKNYFKFGFCKLFNVKQIFFSFSWLLRGRGIGGDTPWVVDCGLSSVWYTILFLASSTFLMVCI